MRIQSLQCYGCFKKILALAPAYRASLCLAITPPSRHRSDERWTYVVQYRRRFRRIIHSVQVLQAEKKKASERQEDIETIRNSLSPTLWNTIYFYTASVTAGNLSYDCARGRHRTVSAAASRRHVDASLDLFAREKNT